MLRILTLATCVQLLGTDKIPQRSSETDGFLVNPEDEILYTLSEVYLSGPGVECFDSVEHPTELYFEDVDYEEDENWLFQAPEDSIEIPQSNPEVHYKEAEQQLDEFDEEMERSWLIDELDQAYDELDGGWSEVDLEIPEKVSTFHNRKERLLSDLKTQFKRLIKYGKHFLNNFYMINCMTINVLSIQQQCIGRFSIRVRPVLNANMPRLDPFILAVQNIFEIIND